MFSRSAQNGITNAFVTMVLLVNKYEKQMTKNMSGLDRVVRVSIGVLLIISAAIGALGPWAYLGALAIIVGLVGNCPLYSLFGVKTCKTPSDPSHS